FSPASCISSPLVSAIPSGAVISSTSFIHFPLSKYLLFRHIGIPHIISSEVNEKHLPDNFDN
ncbi:hypothetical protein IMA40_001965, partial [Salmonella enterica]|nr:hypothetical protein [Salmonella enterica]